MNKTLKNLLHLSFRSGDDEGIPECLPREARRVLRFLLEWHYIGRPKEREKEFHNLLIFDKCAADFLNYREFVECELTAKDIEDAVDFMTELFLEKHQNYEWVPYLWKGLAGHKKVTIILLNFVDKNWESDPVFAASALGSVWGGDPSWDLPKETWQRIASETDNDDLRQRAEFQLSCLDG